MVLKTSNRDGADLCLLRDLLSKGDSPRSVGLFLSRAVYEDVAHHFASLSFSYLRDMRARSCPARLLHHASSFQRGDLDVLLYNGEIILMGNLPITDSSARINVSVLSAYNSFNLLGRTASFLASLPYGVGKFPWTRRWCGDFGVPLRSSACNTSILRELEWRSLEERRRIRKWRQKNSLWYQLQACTPNGSVRS